MCFRCFPVELHLQSLSFMDPEDILTLRKAMIPASLISDLTVDLDLSVFCQTSKYFLALTHEPRLWTAVYCRMRQTHPLNCSESEFATLTPQQTERLLVRASRTQNVFQTSRKDALLQIFPSGQTRAVRRLMALSFLSERFLLSVDDTTVVYIWDMWKIASSADVPDFPCARLTLFGWDFLAHSMSIERSTLYVILSKGVKAHVFSLALPSNTQGADESKLTFRDVAYFDTHFDSVCTIDPDSCLALLHISHTMIEIVDWRTEDRSSIPLLQEMAEAHTRTNNVLALCVCGPYILCFRWHSIDAYPIPRRLLKHSQAPVTDQPLPVLQLAMPGMAFGISSSRTSCSRSLSGDTVVYTLCALAQDARRGTRHYQIHVRTAPVPALTARLLAVDDPAGYTGGRTSAWDLGSTGFRGARARQPDAHGERHVVAFATPAVADLPLEACQCVDLELSGGDGPPGVVPRFYERVVFVVSSWDPGDDVTKCAVSEFTGRIALGSRNGTITVV